MADSAKDVEGEIAPNSATIEPPTVPLVMDMVQRSNGNGAAISIVDLVNRTDGEENVVGLIDAPSGNGSGDGDVTNGKENGNGKDDTDAWPSFGSRTAPSSAIAPPAFIRTPVERDSEVY